MNDLTTVKQGEKKELWLTLGLKFSAEGTLHSAFAGTHCEINYKMLIEHVRVER